MSRVADVLGLALFGMSATALCLGTLALAEARDISAIYWLILGAVVLRAAVDLLRPSRSS